MAGPWSVLLVDDHVMFRQGLRALLSEWPELAVIGEAGDGLEAVAKARELQPDIILMDIKMPVCDGLSAIVNIRQEMPQARIVVLTTDGLDSALVFDAVKAGALGFTSKMVDINDLVQAIRLVVHGKAAITTASLTSLLMTLSGSGASPIPPAPSAKPEVSSSLPNSLSAREREVLSLVAEGLSNREIARALYISESTVHSHVHNILEKLHLENRVQAAIYARSRASTPTGKLG